MGDGSWVGVDLHARSAVAAVLEGSSGELRTERVPAASGPLLEWLSALPRPVRVAYEAGPTGFELARACARAEIACLVAAPGKIPRAPAERVKTDRRRGAAGAAAAAG
jgi:transposase